MFEFLFKYPATVFSRGQFVLLAPWPVWLLVVAVGELLPERSTGVARDLRRLASPLVDGPVSSAGQAGA